MNFEIEESIRKNIDWTKLSAGLKHILGNSPKEYEKHIVNFSIKNQFRFRGNLVRNVLRNEKNYYEKLIEYSKNQLMLFPYHLSDVVIKGLRLTPFNYYLSILEQLIQSENSYDMLPNFTAVDCLRLLKVGRNEYLEIINKSKLSKKRIFQRKNTVSLLPCEPADFLVEPWWIVQIGLIFEDDVKGLSNNELSVIDTIIDYGPKEATQFHYECVVNLYKKGLIYFDVPISIDDRVQVPPLKGFVMNRILGDYFETLLYKTFVSIDEQITVGELGDVLNVNKDLVKQAVSLYCRLGIAKKIIPDTSSRPVKSHSSWESSSSEKIKLCDIHAINPHLSFNKLTNEELLTPSNRNPNRIAFLFDSSLTAYLMMGNLSPSLKNHAVTMFEVGKITDECLDSFLIELEKVSLLDADGEGEARRYFDHAVLLRSTILMLKKLPNYSGLDLIRLESLNSLNNDTCMRLLAKKYKLLVSMAPISYEVRPICDYSIPHLGPCVPDVNSIWFKLFLYHKIGYGPPSLLLIKKTKLNNFPEIFMGYSYLLISTWTHEPMVINVGNISHVNSLLECGPVLIQVYGEICKANTKIIPFPLSDNKDDVFSSYWRNNAVIKKLMLEIDLVHCCGYLVMVNFGVKDLGCSSPNKNVIFDSNFIPSYGSRRKSSEVSVFCNEKVIPVSNEGQKTTFKDQESPTLPQTPIDESVDIFSRLNIVNAISPDDNKGEDWTLLDCRYGIPLFDMNVNTKICESILHEGLTDQQNFQKLAESNRILEKNLIDFINQCQRIENNSTKTTIPILPKYDLMFKYGKISNWNRK